MDVKRRILLKGLTATAAVSMIAPRAVFAGPIEHALVKLRETGAGDLICKPITTVSNEALKTSTFMQAISAVQPTRNVILGEVDFEAMRRLLSQKETNLVGIIDHANAAVLVQLSRHFDAKIHWLGQHAIYAHSTTHNIYRSGDSLSCQTSLVEQLGRCGDSHAIFEQGLNPTRIAGKTTRVAHVQEWAGHLALALHDIGKGVNSAPLVLNQPDQLISGSAVTFLIETC
jgi:hypothetical protein